MRFGRAIATYAKARRGADEMVREQEQDAERKRMAEIQQAAMLANLAEQGIVPEGERETISAELPGFGTIQDPSRGPSKTVDTGIVDQARYKPLGRSGMVQDQTMTRRAKEIAAERQRQQQVGRRVATLRALDPSLRGAGDDALRAIAEDDDAFQNRVQFRKPEEPKAPIFGTPEWAKAYETQRQIDAKYRPAPRSGLPTESERKNSALLMSGEQGYRTLDRLIQTGKKAPSFKDATLAKIGMGAGNYLTSDEYKQMQQASLQLADAWLRVTSGQNAPEAEVQRLAKTLIPQPGDDDGTLLQKAQSRRTIIMAMRQAAGRAAPTAEAQMADERLPYPDY